MKGAIPTLEKVLAEIDRMEAWAKEQFMVLPESNEGKYMEGLYRAKERMEREQLTQRASLFQKVNFVMASGKPGTWKIECDALTPADWEGLAHIAVQYLPPFGDAAGVPRGGWALSAALQQYRTPDCDTLLVVDDVWTTGGSMRKFIEGLATAPGRPITGLVAFARNAPAPWVRALFRMPGPYEAVAHYEKEDV